MRGMVNERLQAVEVAYGTVELAISRMKPGDFMFVIDLADAFFNWRIHPDSSWELGFFCPTFCGVFAV